MLKELNITQMAAVTGGTLSNGEKNYLRSMIKFSKRNGCTSLDQYLGSYKGKRTPEIIDYIRSVWDSI